MHITNYVLINNCFLKKESILRRTNSSLHLNNKPKCKLGRIVFTYNPSNYQCPRRREKLSINCRLSSISWTLTKKWNKSLFPTYPQILLTSKCSKSKFSILLVLNGAYDSTKNIPGWNFSKRYVVDLRNQSWN